MIYFMSGWTSKDGPDTLEGTCKLLKAAASSMPGFLDALKAQDNSGSGVYVRAGIHSNSSDPKPHLTVQIQLPTGLKPVTYHIHVANQWNKYVFQDAVSNVSSLPLDENNYATVLSVDDYNSYVSPVVTAWASPTANNNSTSVQGSGLSFAAIVSGQKVNTKSETQFPGLPGKKN